MTMPKRIQYTREVWLGLVAASVCLIAGLAVLGAPPSAAGAAAAPPTRTIHYGWRGNRGTDNWNSCTDSSGTFGKPIPTTLNARFDGAHELTIQPMSKTEVQAVYSAAFDACFLEDYDEGGIPGGTRRKAWLHDVARFQDGASEAIFQFRPSYKVPKMLTDSLRPNEGFIVGDILNTSATFKYVRPAAGGDMEILPFHSVLVFMGKDANGRMYAALLDLDDFPSRHLAGLIKNITPRNASTMAWRTAPVSRVAFARFGDPRDAVAVRTSPEQTWVDCAPGSCMATAYEKMFQGGKLVAYDPAPARPRAPAPKKP
jgi:hypothetical protein